VKYSLETYMRKELRYLFSPFWRKNITSIEVLGPYQVRVNLKTPDPGFLARMWWGTGIFGKKYRESVGDKGFADKPVGTGPFKWLEYKQDVYWKVEAVPKHFRHTPEYKTLTVRYVPENSTRLAMLKAGEADIVQLIGPHVAEVKADSKFKITLSRYPILQCLIFADLVKPESKSPFLDIRVREAASLAIDRETICKKVLFGVSEPYGDYCSPITWGYDPSIKPDPYNPERAKALLKEAGYPNGFDTSFSTGASGQFWAEAVAANLSAVGIRTKVEVMETGVFIDKVFARNHTGLVPKPLWYNAEKHASAEASDDFIEGMPWAYTTTPEINQAVMDGMKAITEPEMIAAGKRISKAIRESRVRLLLWVNHVPYGVSSRIEYWKPEIGAMPAAAYEMIRLKK
jgi:peptide/nickel transport system substrate-binding protein